MGRRYFGYGSNLNLTDLRGFLADRGVGEGALRVIGPSWLPEHAPVFHYHSGSRGGGALDVVPRVGGAVPGALFDVDDDAWRALDEKEGAGGQGRYARHDVTVLTDDGGVHDAVTYRVSAAHVQPRFVAPTLAYVALARRGLEAFGQPLAQLEAVAVGRSAPMLVREVFVYGTLLSGECREPAMRCPGLEGFRAASLPGRLLDLGTYPGLRLDAAASVSGASVSGELWRYADPADVLPGLDAIEDFQGYGRAGSLYRRALVRARVGARQVLAWTYVLMDGRSHPEIPGGCWRGRASS